MCNAIFVQTFCIISVFFVRIMTKYTNCSRDCPSKTNSHAQTHRTVHKHTRKYSLWGVVVGPASCAQNSYAPCMLNTQNSKSVVRRQPANTCHRSVSDAYQHDCCYRSNDDDDSGGGNGSKDYDNDPTFSHSLTLSLFLLLSHARVHATRSACCFLPAAYSALTKQTKTKSHIHSHNINSYMNK